MVKWDDEIVGDMTDDQKQAYLNNLSQHSIVPYRERTNPGDAWAIPVVTGHKYKIFWGGNIDFEEMQCDISEKW